MCQSLKKHNDQNDMAPRKGQKRKRYVKGTPLWDAAAKRQMLAEQYNVDTARGSAYSRDMYGINKRLANPKQQFNRLNTGFTGDGDYRSMLASASRGIGQTAGAYFGYGDKGRGLGADFSRWMGWGKYHRKNYRGRGDYAGDAGGNQIMEGSADVPITVNNTSDRSGDIYICHREFLGNVTASGIIPSGATTVLSTYTSFQYPINAALPGTFPWLSQVASNFTMYELQGCIFEYNPTSGEFGTTGQNALGKVIMSTQYDPDAGPFTSSLAQENYSYANACKPSEKMLHGVETAIGQRATNLLYCRTGPSTKDKIFTDMGVFQLSTENIPLSGAASTTVTSNIGELWVTYKVKLSRAKLFDSGGLGNATGLDIIYFISDSTSLGGGTAAGLPSLQSGPYYTAGAAGYNGWTKLTNNIGCQGVSSDKKTASIVFPSIITSGTYAITVNYAGISADITQYFQNPANLFNCTLALVPGWANSYNANPALAKFFPAPNQAAAATSANNYFSITFVITVNAPATSQASLTVANLVANAPSGSTMVVMINQVPANIAI